jgi:hypothetical protein
MANKACVGECYPKMMNKKSGKYFQINLKLMIMTDYWQSKKVDFGTIKEMVLGIFSSRYN